MAKIKVIIKEPHKKPRSVNISNTLENLQKTVGGYIETVTAGLWIDKERINGAIGRELVPFCVICNEEGRIKHLENNCVVLGQSFVGTIIICGVDGEEFADLPVPYQQAKRIWPYLWEEEG